MAPSKRNLRRKPPGDETLSGRRSSLQVNLSYVSSLSDSGNGPSATQLENQETAVRKGIHQNRSKAMSDIAENAKSVIDDEEQELSVMRSKEQELNRSCQLLKDAILQKTSEIFNHKADLAVKTSKVLKGQRPALKEINNDSRSVKLPTNLIQSKKDVTRTASPSWKSTLPTKNTKSLTKSFADPMARVSRGNTSVILSGSSKSHRKTLSSVNDKVLSVRLTRITVPRVETSSETPQSSQSSQSSLSSVLEDIGAPITSSSFISGYANSEGRASQRAESEDRECEGNLNVEEAAGPSVQTLTPTEITAVQVTVPSNKKNTTSLGRLSGNHSAWLEATKERSSVREVPMELTTVQSHIPFCDSASSNNTARTSLKVNTSINESSCTSGKRKSAEASLARENSATHLSLRVNTSLATQERSSAQETASSDAVKTKASFTESLRKSVNDSKGNNTDPMENMSLIARLRNISGLKATEAEDRRKKNGSCRSSAGEGPSFVEGTPYPPSRSILWRTQIKSATLNTIRNRTTRKKVVSVSPAKRSSKSSDPDSSASNEYLTPPNTTVVLGDSPSRFTANSGNTQIIPDSSDEEETAEVATTSGKVSNDPSTCKPKECVKDRPMKPPESVPMDISPDISDDPTTQIPNEAANDPSTPILKEAPNDPSRPQEKEMSIDHLPPQSKAIPKNLPKLNSTGNVSRTGKRRLLPIQDPHELVSFSPASPAVPSPKPVRRRRIQKRKAVRAVAAKRIESMREEDVDEPEPGYSRLRKILIAKEKEKTRKPRRIISKKIVVKKIVGADMMDELEALRCAGSDRDSTAARSSLTEFSKKKTVPISGRNAKTQKLVIVATGFSKGDVDLVKSIAKELGGAEISTTVSRRTTHVVSTGVRTINLLRGIIRGCWLVSLEWALKSLEKQKWLSAEDYEMVHFSKAVQENRRDRQLFGKAYVPELFTTCGPIYIEHGTTPPPEILKELVKTAGGRITENLRDAKLTVGPNSLREIWILDSITTGDLQPIKDYQRK